MVGRKKKDGSKKKVGRNPACCLTYHPWHGQFLMRPHIHLFTHNCEETNDIVRAFPCRLHGRRRRQMRR